MRRRTWVTILAVLVAIAALTVAFLARQGYGIADVRRTARETLGLPKFWVTRFNIDTAAHRSVPCPSPGDTLVAVSIGQSNAANSYDVVRPEPAPQNAFMFFDGRCFALRSPVLGATGDRDSLWPRLGAAMAARTGRPVLFINGAVGGSQVGDWLDPRSQYRERLLRQLRLARRAGYLPRQYLWIQGETDASTRIAPDRYLRQVEALARPFRDEGLMAPGARWILYRSTRCLDRPNNGPALDRALTALAERSPDDAFELGPNATALDDRYRRDDCHFNTLGRDRLVDESMASLARYLPAR